MNKNTAKSITSAFISVSMVGALFALLALSGGLACSPVDADEEFFSDPACEGAALEVAGRWTLSGEGSRSGCSDDDLDTDGFRLRAKPFDVSQSGELLELASAPEVPAGASFSFVDTSVRGACVAFTTIEESNARRIHYRWRGRVQSDGSLYGEFEGDGPSSCVSNGTFSVEIK